MMKVTSMLCLGVSLVVAPPSLASGRLTVPRNTAILKEGIAHAPEAVPEEVKKAVWAANEIAGMPYKYGGGHGGFSDGGYDCSGAVSYVLGRLNLIEYPLDSANYVNWGEPGPGKWMTVYARVGHVFIVIAGLRFDTTDHLNIGPGWREDERPPDGFVARHPAGY